MPAANTRAAVLIRQASRCCVVTRDWSWIPKPLTPPLPPLPSFKDFSSPARIQPTSLPSPPLPVFVAQDTEAVADRDLLWGQD